jgi:hypothetical protein
MLRHPGHPCLCLFHARAESQLVETENFGSELTQTTSGDFMTATDINYAMDLYTAVAQDRIPIRNANALARIGRIMLGTIPGVKTEFPFSTRLKAGTKCWTPPRASYPRPPLRLPPRRRSLPAAARRSHIHHSNTTQTRHSERREESLFAFDSCRTLSTHGRRIQRNING